MSKRDNQDFQYLVAQAMGNPGPTSDQWQTRIVTSPGQPDTGTPPFK